MWWHCAKSCKTKIMPASLVNDCSIMFEHVLAIIACRMFAMSLSSSLDVDCILPSPIDSLVWPAPDGLVWTTSCLSVCV